MLRRRWLWPEATVGGQKDAEEEMALECVGGGGGGGGLASRFRRSDYMPFITVGGGGGGGGGVPASRVGFSSLGVVVFRPRRGGSVRDRRAQTKRIHSEK
ncbi:unnamed protein product [Boreogadus saida]